MNPTHRRRTIWRLMAPSVALSLTAIACVPEDPGTPPTTTTTPPSTSTTQPPAPIEPHFTEIHYDNAGADVGEAIEVRAEPGTDLTGWQIVLYNGSNNQTYTPVRSLGPTNELGLWVENYPSNGIQNGSPDGFALVRPDGSVAQFLSYEGTMTAANGPAVGLTSTDIGVAEAGTEEPGQSLQLVGDTWVGPIEATFGTINTGDDGGGPTEPGECVVATHTIGSVQGSGTSTPIPGAAVTIRGVVTADLQTGGYNGFYVQDAGDANAATSDGIFVYAPGGRDVAVGDEVSVVGVAGEFGGLTQLANVSSIEVCDSGVALPASTPLTLPATEIEREALESMLVHPVGELTVTEVYNLNRFGEVVVSVGGPLLNPTEIAEPGPDAAAVMAANAQRSIILDDGLSTNLASANIAPPFLAVGAPLRVGDRVTAVQPSVLSYGFDAWRLQPSDGTAAGTTFGTLNPRPAAPAKVGGDVKVAAFNVLNYFVTYGGDARGAANEAQKNQQEAKIVAAIRGLDADIVGLQEIENSAVTTPATPYAATETLVAALNTAHGAPVWAYVAAHEASDVITNAIIYRNDRVSAVGEPMVLAETATWLNAREPIAATFSVDGDVFSVIVNHLKSKSSGSGPGNVDIGDGQGLSNADRVAQATELVAFAQDVAAAVGDDDIVMLGDFNSYAKEDPVDVIVAGGFVDITNSVPNKYTYVFQGAAGSLDRVFVSPSLAAKVSGFDIWQINAQEAYGYQYNGFSGLYAPDAYRSSDHDPAIVGFNLSAPVT